jgi:hypothetical protein
MDHYFIFVGSNDNTTIAVILIRLQSSPMPANIAKSSPPKTSKSPQVKREFQTLQTKTKSPQTKKESPLKTKSRSMTPEGSPSIKKEPPRSKSPLIKSESSTPKSILKRSPYSIKTPPIQKKKKVIMAQESEDDMVEEDAPTFIQPRGDLHIVCVDKTPRDETELNKIQDGGNKMYQVIYALLSVS